jgi:hypothetical protein
MSTSEFKFLESAKNSNIHWFCNACEVLSKPILTRLVKVEQRLDSVENRMTDIEGRESHSCETVQLGEKLGELERKIHEAPPNIDSIASEISDRVRKSSNLLIHGVPDKNTDEADVEEIFDALAQPYTLMAKPVRLGKQLPDKTRPILVELNSESAKWSVLKNSKTLKGHAKYSKVFLHPDETPIQRDAGFRLRKELRERRGKGEKDLTIRKGKIQSSKN